MGNIFELPDSFATDALDALNDVFDATSQPCTIIFPPIYQDCPNCTTQSALGGITSSFYIHGGPMPFAGGSLCPYCSGSGQHAISSTKEANFVISYTPKAFAKYLPENFLIPQGSIVVKGKIDTLRDIIAAKKLTVKNRMENYITYSYEMSGEPFDVNNIIKYKFWYALFNRVAG